MKKLRETYETAGYKYDAALVMFVDDFISPSVEMEHLLPLVRQWNASGREPKLRVATPHEFFTYIVSKYGSEIPAYKGDWNGLWSNVKTNSPGISSGARDLQSDLAASSLLWGGLHLLSGLSLPSGNLLDDYRRLWNYDEHSGSGQVGWEKMMSIQEVNDQNREYVEYVRNAAADEASLLASALRRAVGNEAVNKATGPDPASLAVFQPLSWQCPVVVDVPKVPGFEHTNVLRDSASGGIYPVQWTDNGGKILAKLKPVSITTLQPVAASEEPTATKEITRAPVLENRFYRVELRLSDGATAHLVDRESGRELINTAARDGFNESVCSIGFRRAPRALPVPRLQKGSGPVFDYLRVLRPGSYLPETEYRLYHSAKRLDVCNLLDGSRMPVVTSEDHGNAYQFTFPFLPGASIDSLHFESGYGMKAFPADYLPGARMDAVVSHGLVLSAGDLHVASASSQAFYWDLTGLVSGSRKLWDNEVISTAQRKGDMGVTRDVGPYLFPTVEPGLPPQYHIDYSVTSWNEAWNDGAAFRKIWELIARTPAAPIKGAGAVTLFGVDQPDVVLLAAEPSLTNEHAVILRLQEISGQSRRVRIKLPSEKLEVTQVDLAEAAIGPGRLPVQSGCVEVDVAPHATVSILVTKHSE